MTIYKILQVIELAGVLEKLRAAQLISKQIFIRYRRYKRFLERSNAQKCEKRSKIIMDTSIDLCVSEQTIYEDIRSMEKEVI